MKLFIIILAITCSFSSESEAHSVDLTRGELWIGSKGPAELILNYDLRKLNESEKLNEVSTPRVSRPRPGPATGGCPSSRRVPGAS